MLTMTAAFLRVILFSFAIRILDVRHLKPSSPQPAVNLLALLMQTVQATGSVVIGSAVPIV